MTDREFPDTAAFASQSVTKARARLLSIRDAAGDLATSERTVWRLIGLGELVKVKIGRSVRVTAESIDAFVKRGGAE